MQAIHHKVKHELQKIYCEITKAFGRKYHFDGPKLIEKVFYKVQICNIYQNLKFTNNKQIDQRLYRSTF